MPIYEYRCQKCGKDFETIISLSADQCSVSCKYCGSTRTKKTISATNSFRISSSSSSTGFGGGSGGCSSSSGFS